MGATEELIGRDETMRRLRAALDRAIGGRGGVVMLAGEPGIGKTAVLGALADEAERRSVPVAWGQCWDDSMAPAFWPWTQVLRELRPDLDASRTAWAPAEPGAAAARDVARERFDHFDAVRTALVDASSTTGLVVVIDDVQWADEGSLALLSFVARHLGRSRVLLVGAHRDPDDGGVLARSTVDVEVIRLRRLADDEAAEVARSAAGGFLASDVVDDVVRRAGGNPLFVRELTRLVSSGPGSSGPAEVVPGGVRDVVGERLERLSVACRDVLGVAALVGPEVPTDVLVGAVRERTGSLAVADRPAGDGLADLADLVAEAARAGILAWPAAAPSPVRFVHDVFREVLAATLSTEAKARTHVAVGRALERLAAGGAPVARATIAAHYVAAASLGARSVAGDAVRCSREAAEEAIGQLAFEDAVHHVRRALAALELDERPDPSVRLDLMLSLGTALDLTGDTVGARRVLVEAAALAGRVGDAEGAARAAIGIHRLGAMSGLVRDQNVRLLEAAVAGLGEGALRARALASLAREVHHAWEPGTHDRARSLAADAVALARRLDDPSTLAFCLVALHDTSWSVGTAAERVTVVDEILRLARHAADAELGAQAQLLRATALLELGDPSALAELERYCRLADGLGHARGRWGAMSRRAVLALLVGDLDEAVVLGKAAAALGDEIGEPDAPGVRDTLLWELARFRGGWSELVPAAHWVPGGTWPPHRAVLLDARGDAAAARAALAGYSLEHDRRQGVRRHDGWMPMVIATAVVAAGSEAQREEVYDWLRPLAGHHLVYGGCMGYGGAVDHHLGSLAASLGRDADAREHAAAARSLHERVGVVAWASLDRLAPAAPASGADTATAAGPEPAVGTLRREGDAWRVTFRGRTSAVRHVKGMVDLAVLLDRPGREVPALELMGGSDVGGAPGPMLDERARREYQSRVQELQESIDEARESGDWVRAERAEVELDALVEQLARAFGLGGRQRTGGGAGERARAAVTHRVRGAIQRIADVDPALGQHLANAVKTGTWCSYRPDVEIVWTVEP